ncbi:DUF4352 domain-containing protein [Saccharothrix variisporea]|uniref:Uncharacterized protein DUF4352 n=1 Tax=Saccharothrix variisporea TaxID=543527 RepID=A0A495XKJ5_9PSEU|nr:DUF4352 domain-containing protein [Saccharothrix variisporea]RKT73394.1 uncharacterized protein DUF4352 [Saccharothrix variisporea]
MRWVLGIAAVLSVAVCTGCTDVPAASEPPPASASATYPVPNVPVRPDEKVLRVPTAGDGEVAFTLLGLTTELPSLVGSHAEMPASQGQFVRIRMSVINNGRSSVSFNARKHVLVDDKKKEYEVDLQAMLIKRQPDMLDLGANVRLEYDVYYDIPKDSKPLGIKVFGGPTLADPQDASGTEILLAQ